MSLKEERINALQIAADCVKLADQYRVLAENYAKQLIECIEARKKTDERLEKLTAALMKFGVTVDSPQTSSG